MGGSDAGDDDTGGSDAGAFAIAHGAHCAIPATGTTAGGGEGGEGGGKGGAAQVASSKVAIADNIIVAALGKRVVANDFIVSRVYNCRR